jgi:hypothetical protein
MSVILACGKAAHWPVLGQRFHSFSTVDTLTPHRSAISGRVCSFASNAAIIRSQVLGIGLHRTTVTGYAINAIGNRSKFGMTHVVHWLPLAGPPLESRPEWYLPTKPGSSFDSASGSLIPSTNSMADVLHWPPVRPPRRLLPPGRSALSVLVIVRHETLVFACHTGRRDHEIGGGAIAGHRDVPSGLLSLARASNPPRFAAPITLPP